MAPRLKVFRYSDGFHAWTVAASSRAKALAAWGMSRDLFKDGAAEEITSGADHDAALKSPGELIERGLKVDVGEVKTSKPAKPSAAQAKAQATVDRLKTELAELDEKQEGDAASLEARRSALEDEAKALATRQAEARRELEGRLAAARKKLR